MDQQQAAEVLRNIDARTKRIEQILPDLPTSQEMREAIDGSIRAAAEPLATREELARTEAKLATKEELAEAVGKLATKEELWAMRDELRDELRRHMDVWAERIGSHVKLIAEANLALDSRNAREHADVYEQLRRQLRTDDRRHADVWKELERMKARLLKVEARPPRKRRVS